MSMQQMERNHEMQREVEMAEMKRQIAHQEAGDESLSEWERARMYSKTWSMEQD